MKNLTKVTTLNVSKILLPFFFFSQFKENKNFHKSILNFWKKSF